MGTLVGVLLLPLPTLLLLLALPFPTLLSSSILGGGLDGGGLQGGIALGSGDRPLLAAWFGDLYKYPNVVCEEIFMLVKRGEKICFVY